MAEAVILSAIESLEIWLQLKMADADRRGDSYEKVCSLFFEKAAYPRLRMADLRDEARKNKLYGVVVGMLDSGLDMKEKLCSVVVGMAEYFWEDNKKKFFSLLVGVADPCKAERLTMNKEEQCRLLIEMTDLWEDDDIKGKLDKEKLHSLVAELEDLWSEQSYNRRLYKKQHYVLLVEIAGLWKHSKGKLNKLKVRSWIAEKVDLWEHEQLFRLICGVALHEEEDDQFHSLSRMKVEEVKNDLRIILDFLTVERLHYLISDVVEMAYDARVLIQVTDSDPLMLFLEIFNWDYSFINRDALGFFKMIKFIQNGLQETKDRILRFGVERSQTLVGFEQGEELVGLEEEIELLLHNEDIGTTIFIRGMGGIGKTTLARELYNHPTVVDQFEYRAWVSLTREFSRKEILMKLILQLVESGKELERDFDASWLEKMDNKSLKQMLQQHLPGMRYFIVLDDVDDKACLGYVMKALPKDKGSRLVFTTRSADIQCNSPYDYNHKKELMDGDKSWKLLLKTVLFCDQELPKHLHNDGRHMLTKNCDGLPLAIKEVGRQWATRRRSGSEWEEIIESMDLSATLATLESTYHNLDPQVQSLFLHLSFFKEGTIIRTKKLLQIWTIGRVVSEVDKQFGHCLSRLCKESIIEVKDMSKTIGGIKKCRVNAVFRRLSIKKAEDDISFEILRNDGKSNRPSHEPRHRVIYCNREKSNYSTNQDKRLVSLFFYGGGYFNASPSYWKHFGQLKTLDMEDFGFKILPDAIGTLIKLRYLGLRNNYIQELPCSLGCLKNLEVLDITLNFMVEVPDIIWDMHCLRHLYMSDISCQKTLTIDALKNLETLTYISADNWLYALWGLIMMASLTKLGIEEVDGNTDVRKLFASLGELENLNHLLLRGFRFRRMPCLDELGNLHRLTQLKLDGLLTRLPSANNFPPNIKYLSLVNSRLDKDPMPILEKLSKLKYLKLQNAFTGQQMAISLNGFGNLRYLVLVELWKLREVQVQRSAMQKLKLLEINSYPYLETIPNVVFWKFGEKELKIVSTKKIATKIRESGFISRLPKLDLQP